MTNTTNRVLAAITDYWRENAIPPTIRNIQAATGLRSTSAVRYCYMKLEKYGEIKRIKSKPVPLSIYLLLCRHGAIEPKGESSNAKPTSK